MGANAEKFIALAFLIAATAMEASGDAIVRIGLAQPSWPLKISLFAAGAALLFGYGVMLNLAPLEFGRVVGLYIATLFVVWQIVSFIRSGPRRLRRSWSEGRSSSLES